MTIDISAYDASKVFILGWFETKGGRDIKRTISYMAQTYHVPCLAVAFWLGEYTNWNDPQCEKSIRSLVDFYGYTEIIGIPKGCPIEGLIK